MNRLELGHFSPCGYPASDTDVIIIVRHGETEWSRSGKHTGRTDIDLTAAGRLQAERLGVCLSRYPLTRVLTSPLKRAAETCRLAGWAAIAEVRDEFVEWDYGDYEGRTTADIRKERPRWSLWIDGTPNGESASDVGRRVAPVLEDLRAEIGYVGVFAHGHVLRVLTSCWLGLPPSDGRLFSLGTATISELGWERETAVIVRWNESCLSATQTSETGK